MANTRNLEREVLDIGKLIGLLTGPVGETWEFNPSWFGDPVQNIEDMGKRLDNLVDLIRVFLPDVAQPSPSGIPEDNYAWHPLPIATSVSPPPFSVVIPAANPPGTENGKANHRTDESKGDAATEANDGTSGQIGFGVLTSTQIRSLDFSTFVYVPLFQYGADGTEFILSSTEHACQFGATVTNPSRFTSGAISFSGVTVKASIFLADQAPSFSLTFEDLQGTDIPSTYTSIHELLQASVKILINVALGAATPWLDQPIGTSPVSVGKILSLVGFLKKTDGAYQLDVDGLNKLQQESPKDIALDFLFRVLDELADASKPLVSLPGNGGFYVEHQTGDPSSDDGDLYGVRMVTQFPLSRKPRTTGQAPPVVTIGLGSWLKGGNDSNNWMNQITGESFDPGVSLLFLKRLKSKKLQFAPQFSLNSVGIDIQGGAAGPLVNIRGVVLRGAEIRTYLDSAQQRFGVVTRLDQVGFPLGPSFRSTQTASAGNNPVAASLLSSGSPQPASPDQSTANPQFSMEAGYILGFDPILKIFDAQGKETDRIWFPVQKRLGPLNCKRVGLKIDVTGKAKKDPVLGVIFEGDVSLSALEVYLVQLSLNIHLRQLAQPEGYQFDLQGLDVTFKSGSVEISGGLLETTNAQGVIEYDGQAIIQFLGLSISALGAFSALPQGGGTSLFIFAKLNDPIGGPPFLFVTGLNAGFGFNRKLKIPAKNEIQQFPLISGLANPQSIGGNQPTPGEALSKLKSWVPPERGQYWLAGGFQFTTFDVINSNALLIVEFGKELIISVIGTATLKQPPLLTLVYAQMDIEVVFALQSGEFRLSAELSPGAYVLLPWARLTGGIAFYCWFGSNAHSGDFTFTMGGYHPAFIPPSYYPQEPRIGVNIQLGGLLTLIGEVYFAITSRAMMLGFNFQFSLDLFLIKVWLRARLDALLAWKPFYFITEVSVSAGVSLIIDLYFVSFTLTLEVGVNFGLWGPPVGLRFYIDLILFSFDIDVGAPQQVPNELSWKDFSGLLPQKTREAAPPSNIEFASLAQAPSVQKTPTYLYINANKGLSITHHQDDLTLWLVRPGQFQFTVGSAIPATTIVVENSGTSGNHTTKSPYKTGLPRVNGGVTSDNYRSQQTVTILQLKQDSIAHIKTCMASNAQCSTHPSGCDDPTTNIDNWTIDPVSKNLPQSMWGEPSKSLNINGDASVTGLAGVHMFPNPPTANYSPEVVIDHLFEDRIVNPNNEDRLSISQQSETSGPDAPTPGDTFAAIRNIDSTSVHSNRNQVFAALQTLGVNGWTNDDLAQMAASPGKAFADEPMTGSTVVA